MPVYNITEFPFSFPAWFPPERDTASARELPAERNLPVVRDVEET